MSEFLAKYSTKKVPIIIENNIVEKSWSILDHSKRYLVITDSNLLKTYDELIYQIPNLITTIALKPGELAKSIEVYQKIITALTKLGVKRNDAIIAFGGGVIGDLVGFVACTYLRGIDFIQIPTTLIAQIDASIGGKCGIDFINKNDIGTFYHPSQVIIDPVLLKSLPKNEFLHGLSELIKYGFIKDASIINDVQRFTLPFKPDVLLSLIERAVKIKIQLTQRDEFDLSIRRLLNFGHTYAHIIERKSKYKISHGEAVAIGMYYELEGTEYQQVLLDLIQKYQLTNQLEKWNISYAADLKTDKKATSTKITMVELEAIGKAKLVDRSILWTHLEKTLD